jgi:RimJ/RimL family protein N-acetyltransferase
MNPDDAEQFAVWFNDAEVTVNLIAYSAHITLEGEREFLKNPKTEHTYSIIDLKTDELIGNCGFHDLDQVNQKASVGIFIGNKNYWNKGYGSEALSLLADFGFKALNLHNLFLQVYDFNPRAIRCYEKVGFRLIGRQREALLRNRERHDILFMDLLADDFYAGKE